MSNIYFDYIKATATAAGSSFISCQDAWKKAFVEATNPAPGSFFSYPANIVFNLGQQIHKYKKIVRQYKYFFYKKNI